MKRGGKGWYISRNTGSAWASFLQGYCFVTAVRHTKSTPTSRVLRGVLTPNFFPVFFFHSRNGLRRKGGTAHNLGLAEYLNIFQTETSSSNWKSSYDGFWPSLFHSWDEMARYDLPAMLKFVVSKTSQPSLYYVGHSQGTLIAFAEFSRNKELAKLVKRFFALGPVTTTGHIESPIKYFRHLGPELEVRINTWQLLPVSPSPFSRITE